MSASVVTKVSVKTDQWSEDGVIRSAIEAVAEVLDRNPRASASKLVALEEKPGKYGLAKATVTFTLTEVI